MALKKGTNHFKHFFSYYLVGIFILFVFVVGLIVGNKTAETPVVNGVNGGEVTGIGEEPPAYLLKDADIDLLWQAWDTVTSNYVDQPVNDVQLLYGAITGLVNSLDDPHSVFLTPQENEDFLKELDGSFFGIGAEITIKNEQLQVVAPLPDTPAERAGLRPGDYIISIDGEDTAGLSLSYAVSIIRGEKGTDVMLTIYTPGDDAPRDVTITRDEIEIESVSWEMMENNIAYLQIRYFNGDTFSDFRAAADEIAGNNPDHIILDLRNNPGGFLDAAIDIASNFIEDGVIVKERLFNGTVTEHDARGRTRLAGYPVTVLINGGSASASEILAGALRDHGIATVVGEQSFGKGSVQTLFNLSDGSSIKLTIAKWLTPSDHTIEGVGITPDIEVELTTEDYNNDRDPQLDKAIELILNKGGQ